MKSLITAAIAVIAIAGIGAFAQHQPAPAESGGSLAVRQDPTRQATRSVPAARIAEIGKQDERPSDPGQPNVGCEPEQVM